MCENGASDKSHVFEYGCHMKRIKVLQIVVLGLLCLCLVGVVGMVGVSAAARLTR